MMLGADEVTFSPDIVYHPGIYAGDVVVAKGSVQHTFSVEGAFIEFGDISLLFSGLVISLSFFLFRDYCSYADTNNEHN